MSSLPTLAQVLDLSLDELIQGKSEKSETGNKIASLVGTILKGVALAMGVAVAVLSVLNAITPQQALPMLGLGLACLAVHAMEDRS